jgi:hypothetical protein
MTARSNENLDVLSCGVKHFQHAFIGHEVVKRRQVNAVGHRIDDGFFALTCHLYQAQDWPERMLAHELGINGNELVGRELPAQRLKRICCFDDLHGCGDKDTRFRRNASI